MKSKLSIVTIFITILFLNGCATSRAIIDVAIPTSNEVPKSNGKEIYINSVIDQRVFEVNPSVPSTPSLDPSEEQSNKIKQRAIARKRNGFGMGLGDILLPEGKTVESLISIATKQAFIENGYIVLNDKKQITDKTYVADVKINKFWSWMNPGFWAIALSTEITTDIAIKNNGATDEKNISVKFSDNFQTGVESNWIEVMQSALKAYITELKIKVNTTVAKESFPVYKKQPSVNKTIINKSVPVYEKPTVINKAVIKEPAPVYEKSPTINKTIVKEPTPVYEIPATKTTIQNPVPYYENERKIEGIDLRHCLDLPTNEAIAKCAKRGR